jgi:hypothetical protein
VIFWITIGNKKAALYKGAYKPVKVTKNGKELTGWKMVGSTDTEFDVPYTYDDFITVYGKTDYSAASNSNSPSPDNVKEILHASGKVTVSDHRGQREVYEVPELKGIEVSEVAPYNYKETVNGVTKYYISDSLKNGKIVRRVGKLVIDENQEIYDFREVGNTCRIAITSFKDRTNELSRDELSNALICDRFQASFGYTIDTLRYDYEHTSADYPAASQYQFIFINKERLNEVSLDGVRQWLKENNVTLYYPLKEPVTENADLRIKSYPQKTKIKVINKENAPSLGMAQCIKISK